MINLSIVDEDGELENDFGNIDKKTIQKIIDNAKQSNMACLSFISFDAETRFNTWQAREMKKEIQQLSLNKSLDKNTLNIIEQARQLAAAEIYTELKFAPVS